MSLVKTYHYYKHTITGEVFKVIASGPKCTLIRQASQATRKSRRVSTSVFLEQFTLIGLFRWVEE